MNKKRGRMRENKGKKKIIAEREINERVGCVVGAMWIMEFCIEVSHGKKILIIHQATAV